MLQEDSRILPSATKLRLGDFNDSAGTTVLFVSAATTVPHRVQSEQSGEAVDTREVTLTKVTNPGDRFVRPRNPLVTWNAGAAVA
jgi:hypothetical protein